MSTTGVYKRPNSPFWHYRVGRKIRRSSGSIDINEAIAQREQVIALRRHRACSDTWRAWVAEQRSDSNSWLRRTHTRMKRKSEERGWVGCISLEELVKLTLKSDGKCALTGMAFAANGPPKDPFSISIDRIDCSLGYCAGNVRLVLLAVNIAMSHWGIDVLMRISKALVGLELIDSVRKSSTTIPCTGNREHVENT